MSEWKEYKLGELVEVINGFAFKSANFFSEQKTNSLPVIKIRNVANGDTNLTDVQYHTYNKSLEKYIVKNNDILIALTGNHPQAMSQVVGQVSRFKLNNTALLNQRVAKIKPLEQIDRNYLYYFLKDDSTHDFLANQSSGSANQANISKADIEKLVINLPNKVIQQSIAAILSSLDDKIDLLHRQNATLEALAETLFRQWFVEEAKDEWEEGIFGDVINIFDHLRIPLSRIERDKKKEGTLYPYYGAASIMDYINDFLFDGEYILLGEDGTVRTDDGYPVLQYATGKFWVNNHAHVIKAIEPYNNFFLLNYLKKTNIDNIVTGAVQPKINQGNLINLPFPKYPINIVRRFNEETESIFLSIKSNKSQIRTLTTLRDTLLPKLMSGELRVV